MQYITFSDLCGFLMVLFAFATLVLYIANGNKKN